MIRQIIAHTPVHRVRAHLLPTAPSPFITEGCALYSLIRNTLRIRITMTMKSCRGAVSVHYKGKTYTQMQAVTPFP